MTDDLELQLKRERAMHRMAYQHAARTDVERAEADLREARALTEVARLTVKNQEWVAREAELLTVLELPAWTKWEDILAAVKEQSVILTQVRELKEHWAARPGMSEIHDDLELALTFEDEPE